MIAFYQPTLPALKATPHIRYLVVIADDHKAIWVVSDDLDVAAEEAVRRAAGKLATCCKMRVYRFRSSMPFAPPGRLAREDESDLVVDTDGTIYWTKAIRGMAHSWEDARADRFDEFHEETGSSGEGPLWPSPDIIPKGYAP